MFLKFWVTSYNIYENGKLEILKLYLSNMWKTQFLGLDQNIELKERKLKNREVNIIEN